MRRSAIMNYRLTVAAAAIVGFGVAALATPAWAETPVVREAPPLLLVPPANVLENTPAAPSVVEPAPETESPALLPADEAPDAFTPSAEFQEWISAVARAHLPHQYEKKKNWGHTTRSLDGLSVRIDDGRLKTRRKYKQANDGRWQMYRVELVNPEKNFDVRLANIQQQPDGRIGMDFSVVARLKVFARQSQWEHGIQLYSVSVNADTRVRLTAHANVATQLDPTRFPPDIQLSPEIATARLEILDFELERVSDLHGPLIRSLSHTVREVLEEKLKEDNAKLVRSMNKQIAKQEKKLRLSASELVESKWSDLLGQQAPK